MNSNTRLTSSSRIGAFDGLRGIAVIMVVIGHAWLCFGGPHQEHWHLVGAIIGNAGFGVQLFFVLSGYLITSLLIKERDQTKSVSLWRFYVRRTLRIFPAFYAFLAVIGLLAQADWIHISLGQFVSAATYTKNYSGLLLTENPGEGSWFLGHLWTLSLEEQFYLVWPLVFVISPRRWLPYIPIVAIIVMPFLRVASYFLFPAQRGILTMMFHTSADSILMGCAFALWQTHIIAMIDRHMFVSRWLLCLMTIPLFVSPLMVARYRGAYAITVGHTLDALCAAILVIATHRCRVGSSVRPFLEIPWLQWLGRLSYSLYLWQQLFLNPFQKPWTFWWPLAIGAALGAAALSFYGIEQPILKLKARFSPGAPPVRTAASAMPPELSRP